MGLDRQSAVVTEFRCSGGIDRHLEDLRAATLAWLDYEDSQSEVVIPGQAASITTQLMSIATMDNPGPKEKPEQPETLALYRKLKMLNMSYWPGAYFHQPYILMLELSAVQNAEIEHRNNKAKLLKFRAAAQTGAGQYANKPRPPSKPGNRFPKKKGSL